MLSLTISGFLEDLRQKCGSFSLLILFVIFMFRESGGGAARYRAKGPDVAKVLWGRGRDAVAGAGVEAPEPMWARNRDQSSELSPASSSNYIKKIRYRNCRKSPKPSPNRA